MTCKEYLVQVTYQVTTHVPVMATTYAGAAGIAAYSTRIRDEIIPFQSRPDDLRLKTRVDLVHGPSGPKAVRVAERGLDDYETLDETP